MEIFPTKLEGAYEIKYSPHGDDRGYFMRVYDEDIFRQNGLQTRWVQENQSKSKYKHTIRGFHFQRPPYAETKLVRVVSGAVLDVFIDLRKKSSTFGEWDCVELTTSEQNAVYVPRGFAHAFCSLAEDTIVTYKVDNVYAPDFEGSLKWDDDRVRVDWPTSTPHLSEKDSRAPILDDFESPF